MFVLAQDGVTLFNMDLVERADCYEDHINFVVASKSDTYTTVAKYKNHNEAIQAFAMFVNSIAGKQRVFQFPVEGGTDGQQR